MEIGENGTVGQNVNPIVRKEDPDHVTILLQLIEEDIVLEKEEMLQIAFSGMDVTDCSEDLCTIDGNWGDWSPWSSCGNNCKKTRSRSCDNPAQVNRGEDCVGDQEESSSCCFGQNIFS